MRTIWKYSIAYNQNTVGTFSVPESAELLHVAADVLNPGSLSIPTLSIWFEVDANAALETRVFEVFGTGWELPDSAGAHVGSVLAPPLALHVYERDLSSPDSGREADQ